MADKTIEETGKIFLINPPHDLSRGARRADYALDVSLPLGLAYIGAALEQAGFAVSILDAKVGAYSFDRICRAAEESGARIIGLSAYTADFHIALELARKLKSQSSYKIIIGGRHVSAVPEETLRHDCFDYGVIGEGERTAVELANAIIRKAGSDEIERIKGIVFRRGHEIIRTYPRPNIENLDYLPLPARHLFPSLKAYNQPLSRFRPPQNAGISTSRGCAYKCIFCDRAVFGDTLRSRSIKNVIDEIQLLIREYGVKKITIMDEMFIANPGRVEEFCRELSCRNIRIDWSCFSRADSLALPLFKTMKKSGCWMIGFGIESGDQKILDNADKRTRLDQIEITVKAAAKTGILTTGYFVLGLPGENEQSMRRTLDFARKLPLDRAAFYIAQPFPGSLLYKQARQNNEIDLKVDYRYYHNYYFPEQLAYLAPGLSRELLFKYSQRANREFYLRAGYILRQFLRAGKKGWLTQMVFLSRALSFLLRENRTKQLNTLKR